MNNAARLREVAIQFLRLGATAYGGPAIMGIMQTELQEKRQWVRKDRFVEGVSLANLVPGATATQLAIFLGYARAGWWGGLLGGLCFIVPGFVIMLALTLAYATLGVSPIMRGALYGLGPVVLGIYVVAVYRLGQSSVTATSQLMLAVAAAAAMLGTALGIVAILLLAGGVGLFLFHSRSSLPWHSWESRSPCSCCILSFGRRPEFRRQSRARSPRPASRRWPSSSSRRAPSRSAVDSR
jgi:chromate transporter